MSLYLDYRPKTFDDLVGQQHITDVLRAQIQAGSFSHNYLLYGPRGTGKTTIARLLAKAVNVPLSEDGSVPDLRNAPAAKLIDMGQTLDFVEIDAASHTGVDNIREEIIDKVLYPPTNLQKKVYVIDEVHMLSKGAFNALLKIMEEPPSYLVFILATTEINKLPDTIVSRCQVFNFKKLTIDQIVERIKYIAQQESIDYDEDGLRLLAKLANGAVRDGIKYLEQVSMLGTVTQETVSTFLWVVPETVLAEFVELLRGGDFAKISTFLDELSTGGNDLHQFAKDLLLRVDEHFLDDPVFASALADVLKEIVAGIRSYPYPLMIYKTAIWKWLHSDGQSQTSTTAPAQSSQSADSWASSPAPAVKQESTTSQSSSEQPSAPDKPASDSWNWTTSPPKSETDTWASSDATDDLMQQLIEQVDKVMVRSILKKNAVIDTVEDNVVSIIVINEQYYTTLNKAETSEYIQSLLTKLRGEETTVKRTYMSKEDYLQKQLAG